MSRCHDILLKRREGSLTFSILYILRRICPPTTFRILNLEIKLGIVTRVRGSNSTYIKSKRTISIGQCAPIQTFMHKFIKTVLLTFCIDFPSKLCKDLTFTMSGKSEMLPSSTMLGQAGSVTFETHYLLICP